MNGSATVEPPRVVTDADNAAWVRAERRRHSWLHRVRPNTLAVPLYKLFQSYERRAVVEVEGIAFLTDPLSYTAGRILEEGTYEPATVSILRRHLKHGDVYLDVGANEGFLAAVAATIVGLEGVVLAVEPQSAVFRVLEANMRLNARGRTFLFNKALAAREGERLELHLTAPVNSGGASIVRRATMARRETVTTTTLDAIVRTSGITRIDFIKVDAEGYEKEIVDGLVASPAFRIVRTLCLDYHISVLAQRGIDPHDIEASILSCGLQRIEPPRGYEGYVIYRRAL